jgi:hypothetical protein
MIRAGSLVFSAKIFESRVLRCIIKNKVPEQRDLTTAIPSEVRNGS